MAGLIGGPGTGQGDHREARWGRIPAAGGLALGALLLALATLGWAAPPTAEAGSGEAAVQQGEPGGFAVAVEVDGNGERSRS